MNSDIKAVLKNDPAAKSTIDVIINHMPFHTILMHRLMHPLYRAGIPILPRFIMNLSKVWSGAEIHPGAKIGLGFFIDHGAATVIGETAEIGNNCIIFHNVTLGGTGKHDGKRHPTLGNNVLVGTGATLLGPITIGNNVKIGAETFVIMKDIPSNCTVVGVPGKIVWLDGKKANKELKTAKFNA
ncbi:MAG: serine O-acetyltransferase [Candidatus Diapherotrites archaeon CG11_big_fil_rev_8_21_14_0_20_37_9]|nr:MAG: serine O-acetyltransferase [Candidatus Diapherotrites archaeon CG11_big_fil_rev_8_21_14_0_20_37_9]